MIMKNKYTYNVFFYYFILCIWIVLTEIIIVQALSSGCSVCLLLMLEQVGVSSPHCVLLWYTLSVKYCVFFRESGPQPVVYSLTLSPLHLPLGSRPFSLLADIHKSHEAHQVSCRCTKRSTDCIVNVIVTKLIFLIIFPMGN